MASIGTNVVAIPMKLLDDLFFCLLLVSIAIYLSSLSLCEIKKPLKILNGPLTAIPRIYRGSTYKCLNTSLRPVQRDIFHQETV
jgi:hypothetical protein